MIYAGGVSEGQQEWGIGALLALGGGRGRGGGERLNSDRYLVGVVRCAKAAHRSVSCRSFPGPALPNETALRCSVFALAAGTSLGSLFAAKRLTPHESWYHHCLQILPHHRGSVVRRRPCSLLPTGTARSTVGRTTHFRISYTTAALALLSRCCYSGPSLYPAASAHPPIPISNIHYPPVSRPSPCPFEASAPCRHAAVHLVARSLSVVLHGLLPLHRARRHRCRRLLCLSLPA